MFKKIAIGISCILTVTAGALLTGCGEAPDYDELYADKVKVVYELEGGKYLNSTTRVSHYYDYSDNLKIIDLSDGAFSKDGVTRDGGYILEGWYQTRTVGEDGVITYSDPWDFDKSFVTKGGVTLYAKWKAPIKYSYDFVYIDGDGNEQTIPNGRYSVPEAGMTFGSVYKNDVLSYAVFTGHTALAVYYEYKDGEYLKPFDDSVVHEESENGGSIKIYVNYLNGEYALVSTAEQLIDASTKSKNIYLTADIDMEGEALSFEKFRGREFAGNGHTVSNFTLGYTVSNTLTDVDDATGGNRDALCIALFGNARNLKVSEVAFENMSVTVNVDFSQVKRIYVAPLAVTATNSSFEKVAVSGSFKYGVDDLPDEFDIAKLVLVTDKGVYLPDDVEKECRFEITVNE